MSIEFISNDYVQKVTSENPKPLTELGEFVYYRTYSRWLEHRGRREYWQETVKRAIEYNMALGYKHMRDIGYKINLKEMKEEAEKLFKNIYETKQFPSGRTLWLGNANEKVNKDFVLGNFNCSFLTITKWEDLVDLFYLLMVGCGVGLKSTKKMAANMPKIKVNTKLLHSEYKPVAVEQRLENTKVVKMDNGFAKIYVGDSKNGWVNALKEYFILLTNPENEDIHTIKISYNSVRPRGERLKTFGGTASGHEPLKEMFEGINNVFKNRIDHTLAPIEMDEKGYGQIRPIHILDIANFIGANVVVGGVRRTSEIFLFDADDFESMFAKYGINGIWGEEGFNRHELIKSKMIDLGVDVPKWFDELSVKHYDVVIDSATNEKKTFTNEHEAIKFALELGQQEYFPFPYNSGRPLHHRRMSNNSIAFTKKPTKQFLNFVFTMMRSEGEPAFVNLEEAARRVAKAIGYKKPSRSLLEAIMVAIGLNPCVEIILFLYNVCNLTTINVTQFLIKNADGTYSLDLDGLLEAQRLSARIGLRMTLVDLELPHWSKTQQRDRLIGTSLTGWQDMLSILKYTPEQEQQLMEQLKFASRDEAESYARQLRIPSPLLATTVKPEGTLSQVARNPITDSPVSSGLHNSHAPFFVRRVRINSNDPLVQVAKELGWVIHAEVGTDGFNKVEDLAKPEVIENARTLVVDFPVKSGALKTKDDTTIKEQFDTYFNFQKHYTEHNSSNTIYVKPHEWEEAEQIVFDNWDDFVGVSFLESDGGTYTLAPYETITEEEYELRKSKMKKFDPNLLRKYEQSEATSDLENMESCESGVCPIR